MSTVLYAEMTPSEFRVRLKACPVAYLPLGTLEWHGEHLPLGTDALLAYDLFVPLAQKVGGVVLPMVFMGPDKPVDGAQDLYGMDGWTGEKESGQRVRDPAPLEGSAYWMPDELFSKWLEAVFRQLKRAGFKAVVVHGHGPSVGQAIREGGEEQVLHGLKLFNCWGYSVNGQWQAVGTLVEKATGITGGHGGSDETAGVLALRPELVRLDLLPKNPSQWPVGVGGQDPRGNANREKGLKMVEIQLQWMEKLLDSYLQAL